MPLQEIRASFLCDGCGRPFSLTMESPYEPPAGWSLYDCAVDAVRGSVGYDGPKGLSGLAGSSSVRNDAECLCGRCTEEEDSRSDGG